MIESKLQLTHTVYKFILLYLITLSCGQDALRETNNRNSSAE